jgi:hypothetical protein
MAVLSAGTFANIITTVVFFIIMILFFTLAFSPGGVNFNTYSYSNVEISNIISVNGINITENNYQGLLDLLNETGYNEIKTKDKNYLATKKIIEMQNINSGKIVLYDDSPAIRSELKGPIIKVDGQKIKGWDEFGEIMELKSPGEKILITSLIDEKEKEYEIILGENPENSGKAWLGIGYSKSERKGIIGKMVNGISSFKKEYIYYEPKFKSGEFIYNLLWWLVLISFSVALVNMLPMGIFDGGRFFYLTILGITKSEKKAKKAFKIITSILLFLLVLLMFFWAKSFF